MSFFSTPFFTTIIFFFKSLTPFLVIYHPSHEDIEARIYIVSQLPTNALDYCIH